MVAAIYSASTNQRIAWKDREKIGGRYRNLQGKEGKLYEGYSGNELYHGEDTALLASVGIKSDR